MLPHMHQNFDYDGVKKMASQKSPQISSSIIPAKDGIRYYQALLDSGLRRSDAAE
jgi:hypothetical protein